MALSVDDVFENPAVLSGLTPDDFDDFANWGPLWRVEKLGQGVKEGLGWLLREYNARGIMTGRLIYWHPGGGHHGKQPYWRVASSKTGKSDRIH
ncbi:MAG: hypothetical protein WD557_00805 [Dehalococcoidia bacterium]